MSNHTCSDRPLPTCKTSIVVTATIFTLFKASTKETTKEVARPKAATPLFVVAANGRHLCVSALNEVNVVAVALRLVVLHVGIGMSEHV